MSSKRYNILIEKFLTNQLTPKEELVLNKIEESLIEHTFIENIDQLKKQTKKNTLSQIVVVSRKKLFPLSFKLFGFVASIILIIGFVYTTSILDRNDIIISSKDTIKSLPLIDGSTIILNRTSKLSYPKDYNEKQRNVVLKGEAFFNVMKNKEKPFQVSINQLKVTVLGTSFNIKEKDESIEVAVATGQVKVESNTQSLLANPNEKITFKNGLLSKIHTESKLSTYWFKDSIDFDKASIMDVKNVLENIYNTKVQIIDTINSNRIIKIRIDKKYSLKKNIDNIEYINATKIFKTINHSN